MSTLFALQDLLILSSKYIVLFRWAWNTVLHAMAFEMVS